MRLRARRNRELSEALHELRRPLQVLALAADGGRDPVAGPLLGESLRLAALALERLEREAGPRPATAAGPVAVRPVLEASLAHLRPRAALAGKTVELRWRAGQAMVRAEPWDLIRVLDNLVDNAVKHGGPRIAVEAGGAEGRLRLVVADFGRPLAAPSTLPPRRLRPARRRGQGLRIVRRCVAGLGGRFSLRVSPGGAEAVVELPLLVGAEADPGRA